MQPCNSTDTVTAGKNSHFILSERLDFPMVDNQSIPLHAFPMRIFTSLLTDEILLPRNVKRNLLISEICHLM